MYMFKNMQGQVWTSSIEIADEPRWPGTNRYNFMGFKYQFEDPEKAVGGIVICPVDAWIDVWLKQVQETDPEAVAVKLQEVV